MDEGMDSTATTLHRSDQDWWDLAMLVRHASLEAFLGLATDPGYLAGVGHREAAMEDSRQQPMEDRARL